MHSFGELVGVTPQRYVVELRIAYAARLLVETRAPVTDVCFESGFGSVARFSAAFRAAFDVAPTTYRSRYWRQLTSSHRPRGAG